MTREYIGTGIYMDTEGARLYLRTAKTTIWMPPETALALAGKMKTWAEEVIAEYPLETPPKLTAAQCAEILRECSDDLRLDNDKYENEHRRADNAERARDINETMRLGNGNN